VTKKPTGKDYDAAKKKWEDELASPKCRQLRDRFETISFREIKPLYTPEDLGHEVPEDYMDELGFPGQHPYTRGVHPTMYRGRTWTMRQFSGFGTAGDTNGRYKYILEQGGTGLSVAFDMPTLMGYDSDHKRSEGEVGKCGVAVSSLADMETLFDGIPLDRVSTSMTINGPAAILWAFYIAVGEKQGVSSDKLRGTIQNDILKEYIAQKSWIFPPRPSMRLTPCRNSRSRSPTGSHTSKPVSKPGSKSTGSRRAFRTSSMPTPISSRRSQSSGPRAASGRSG
jgi:methylmalonyl-CoA mutase N-terminal domain/subunit